MCEKNLGCKRSTMRFSEASPRRTRNRFLENQHLLIYIVAKLAWQNKKIGRHVGSKAVAGASPGANSNQHSIASCELYLSETLRS